VNAKVTDVVEERTGIRWRRPRDDVAILGFWEGDKRVRGLGQDSRSMLR